MANLLRIVVLMAASIPATTAFWRMPCPSRLIQERIDPIISPGQIAAHVHTVAGGNGFGFTMDYAQARASECSSCPIKQDLSAYWTPKLYFKAQNGSFIGVPQAGDYNGLQGGMTVYYLQRPGPKNDKLRAFPEGFRMVAGNPYKRNFTGDFAAEAISFNCLNYAGGGPPEGNALPSVNCPNGVRAQVFFPSCWDGVNLDSPNHQSHMAYPESGAYNDGPCPASHPVHMVSLFYETIYSTDQFADMWYGNDQPFVFAQGDPHGYGYHGDFVNGWDVNVLQQAVDECTNLSGNMEDCPVFQYFTTAQSQGCKVPVVLSTNVDGPRPTLPGCNPVTYGPEPAVPAANCGLPNVVAPSQNYKDLTSTGWKYLGCGTDDVNSRTFTGATEANNMMTVESCVDYCKGKGFSYAGLEFGTQCYCGNSLPSDRAPVKGNTGSCFMRCGGDSKQFCGGGSALSIYQSCAGGSCSNPTVNLPGGLPVAKRSLDGHLHRHARKHANAFGDA